MENKNLSIYSPSLQVNPQTSKVAIVTDSIAQVPESVVRELNIHVLQYYAIVDGVPLKDLSENDLSLLYRRMRRERDFRLSTSAPSIGEYYEEFMRCFENGAENIVYVGIATRLSHAFSIAVEAARMVQEDTHRQSIWLFDTCMATAAQGFLATEAARLAKQGVSPNEILKHIKIERQRTGFAAGLETLEFLARGGRIGKAAYLLGSAIRILPVVSLNDKGEVTPISSRRSYKRVLEEIIRYVKVKTIAARSLSLAVMHADALEWAEKLHKMAMEQFQADEIFITNFTPTMVAHTGPGLIGLAYHWKL
jgi:DegV family protein with EDD domain